MPFSRDILEVMLYLSVTIITHFIKKLLFANTSKFTTQSKMCGSSVMIKSILPFGFSQLRKSLDGIIFSIKISCLMILLKIQNIMEFVLINLHRGIIMHIERLLGIFKKQLEYLKYVLANGFASYIKVRSHKYTNSMVNHRKVVTEFSQDSLYSSDYDSKQKKINKPQTVCLKSSDNEKSHAFINDSDPIFLKRNEGNQTVIYTSIFKAIYEKTQSGQISQVFLKRYIALVLFLTQVICVDSSLYGKPLLLKHGDRVAVLDSNQPRLVNPGDICGNRGTLVLRPAGGKKHYLTLNNKGLCVSDQNLQPCNESIWKMKQTPSGFVLYQNSGSKKCLSVSGSSLTPEPCVSGSGSQIFDLVDQVANEFAPKECDSSSKHDSRKGEGMLFGQTDYIADYEGPSFEQSDICEESNESDSYEEDTAPVLVQKPESGVKTIRVSQPVSNLTPISDIEVVPTIQEIQIPQPVSSGQAVKILQPMSNVNPVEVFQPVIQPQVRYVQDAGSKIMMNALQPLTTGPSVKILKPVGNVQTQPGNVLRVQQPPIQTAQVECIEEPKTTVEVPPGYKLVEYGEDGQPINVLYQPAEDECVEYLKDALADQNPEINVSVREEKECVPVPDRNIAVKKPIKKIAKVVPQVVQQEVISEPFEEPRVQVIPQSLVPARPVFIAQESIPAQNSERMSQIALKTQVESPLRKTVTIDQPAKPIVDDQSTIQIIQTPLIPVEQPAQKEVVEVEQPKFEEVKVEQPSYKFVQIEQPVQEAVVPEQPVEKTIRVEQPVQTPKIIQKKSLTPPQQQILEIIPEKTTPSEASENEQTLIQVPLKPQNNRRFIGNNTLLPIQEMRIQQVDGSTGYGDEVRVQNMQPMFLIPNNYTVEKQNNIVTVTQTAQPVTTTLTSSYVYTVSVPGPTTTETVIGYTITQPRVTTIYGAPTTLGISTASANSLSNPGKTNTLICEETNLGNSVPRKTVSSLQKGSNITTNGAISPPLWTNTISQVTGTSNSPVPAPRQSYAKPAVCVETTPKNSLNVSIPNQIAILGNNAVCVDVPSKGDINIKPTAPTVAKDASLKASFNTGASSSAAGPGLEVKAESFSANDPVVCVENTSGNISEQNSARNNTNVGVYTPQNISTPQNATTNPPICTDVGSKNTAPLTPVKQPENLIGNMKSIAQQVIGGGSGELQAKTLLCSESSNMPQDVFSQKTDILNSQGTVNPVSECKNKLEPELSTLDSLIKNATCKDTQNSEEPLDAEPIIIGDITIKYPKGLPLMLPQPNKDCCVSLSSTTTTKTPECIMNPRVTIPGNPNLVIENEILAQSPPKTICTEIKDPVVKENSMQVLFDQIFKPKNECPLVSRESLLNCMETLQNSDKQNSFGDCDTV